jgi:hypothetical protein
VNAPTPSVAETLQRHRADARRRLERARRRLVVVADDECILPDAHQPTAARIRDGLGVSPRALTLAVDAACDHAAEPGERSDTLRDALDDLAYSRGWMAAAVAILGN